MIATSMAMRRLWKSQSLRPSIRPRQVQGQGRVQVPRSQQRLLVTTTRVVSSSSFHKGGDGRDGGGYRRPPRGHRHDEGRKNDGRKFVPRHQRSEGRERGRERERKKSHSDGAYDRFVSKARREAEAPVTSGMGTTASNLLSSLSSSSSSSSSPRSKVEVGAVWDSDSHVLSDEDVAKDMADTDKKNDFWTNDDDFNWSVDDDDMPLDPRFVENLKDTTTTNRFLSGGQAQDIWNEDEDDELPPEFQGKMKNLLGVSGGGNNNNDNDNYNYNDDNDNFDNDVDVDDDDDDDSYRGFGNNFDISQASKSQKAAFAKANAHTMEVLNEYFVPDMTDFTEPFPDLPEEDANKIVDLKDHGPNLEHFLSAMNEHPTKYARVTLTQKHPEQYRRPCPVPWSRRYQSQQPQQQQQQQQPDEAWILRHKGYLYVEGFDLIPHGTNEVTGFVPRDSRQILSERLASWFDVPLGNIWYSEGAKGAYVGTDSPVTARTLQRRTHHKKVFTTPTLRRYHRPTTSSSSSTDMEAFENVSEDAAADTTSDATEDTTSDATEDTSEDATIDASEVESTISTNKEEPSSSSTNVNMDINMDLEMDAFIGTTPSDHFVEIHDLSPVFANNPELLLNAMFTETDPILEGASPQNTDVWFSNNSNNNDNDSNNYCSCLLRLLGPADVRRVVASSPRIAERLVKVANRSFLSYNTINNNNNNNHNKPMAVTTGQQTLTVHEADRDVIFYRYAGWNRKQALYRKSPSTLIVHGECCPQDFFLEHFGALCIDGLPPIPNQSNQQQQQQQQLQQKTKGNVTVDIDLPYKIQLTQIFQPYCSEIRDRRGSVTLVRDATGIFTGRAYVGFDRWGEMEQVAETLYRTMGGSNHNHDHNNSNDDKSSPLPLPESFDVAWSDLTKGVHSISNNNSNNNNNNVRVTLTPVKERELPRGKKRRGGRPERSTDELLVDLHHWKERFVDNDPKLSALLQGLIDRETVTLELLDDVFITARYHNKSFGPVDLAVPGERLEPTMEPGERYRNFVRGYIRMLAKAEATPERPGPMVEAMFSVDEEVDLSLIDGPFDDDDDDDDHNEDYDYDDGDFDDVDIDNEVGMKQRQ